MIRSTCSAGQSRASKKCLDLAVLFVPAASMSCWPLRRWHISQAPRAAPWIAARRWHSMVQRSVPSFRWVFRKFLQALPLLAVGDEPRSRRARAMRWSVSVNPYAMRVKTRILVFVDSIKPLDSLLRRALRMPVRRPTGVSGRLVVVVCHPRDVHTGRTLGLSFCLPTQSKSAAQDLRWGPPPTFWAVLALPWVMTSPSA